EFSQQDLLSIFRKRGDFDFFARWVFAPAIAAMDAQLVLLQVNRALGTLQPPRAVPGGASAAGAPVAGVAEAQVVVELQQHFQTRVMLIPAPRRIEGVRGHAA